MASAVGRARSNHGETMALRAAALIAPQPAPLSALTTNSCQGAVTVAQPITPAARQSAPALVTAAAAKRRSQSPMVASRNGTAGAYLRRIEACIAVSPC